MIFELPGQNLMCPVIFTDQKRACRIHIDPMYDPGTHHTIDPRKIFPAVIHQSIDQSPCIMPWRRMYDHSLRFVYHKQISVLIKDVKRNLLWQNIRHFQFRNLKFHLILTAQLIICFYLLSIDFNQSIFDQFLNIGTGPVRNLRRQKFVDPLICHCLFCCKKTFFSHDLEPFFCSTQSNS